MGIDRGRGNEDNAGVGRIVRRRWRSDHANEVLEIERVLVLWDMLHTGRRCSVVGTEPDREQLNLGDMELFMLHREDLCVISWRSDWLISCATHLLEHRYGPLRLVPAKSAV